MKRFIRWVVVLGWAWASGAPSNAAELKLPRDGWVAWEVQAVEHAPAACCWQGWSGGEMQRRPCALDAVSGGYSTRDRETTDTVKVYARSTAGKLDRLRVLAADCPVESRTPIQELAGVSSEDSARWLMARARQDDVGSSESTGQNALAALSLHRGELPREALSTFALSDPRVEARKWSIFWLALVRGEEGAAVVGKAMFTDRDAEVRQHAAFAMAQSKSPRAAPDLIRLGNSDKVGEVRAQAWFWLAQTGATQAEPALTAALQQDADEQVREKAVFALSQLPDDRATRALISVAENQALSREQRKRAVFWLSQSESDAAQAYLERVLLRN